VTARISRRRSRHRLRMLPPITQRYDDSHNQNTTPTLRTQVSDTGQGAWQ